MKFIKNEQFNSLEIKFDEKPSQAVRDILKDNHFRWHSVKKVWYGYKTQEEIEKALQGALNETTKAPKQIECNHSFKVGDILASSWGYNQTNNSFYQVVKVSKSCVWLIAVRCAVLETRHEGFMCEDRKYSTNDPTPISKEPFRKTVQNYSSSKDPRFDSVSISSYESALKYDGQWLYCSWYA